MTRAATLRARWLLLAILAVAAIAPLAFQRSAHAHPLGNFTINRYARLELYRDTIRVHYVLDYAEIPTFQLKEAADTDADGRLSQAEADSYGLKLSDTVAKAFDLTVDGKRLETRALEQRMEVLPGQGGLEILRATIVYDAPVAARGAIAVKFVDNNYAERAGWREIVVRPSEGARATFEQRFAVDQSNALQDYPAEALSSAPQDREVALQWEAGTGQAAPGAVEIAKAAGRSAGGGFASLLDRDTSIAVVLLSLLVAFVLGAQHAIGPGHGKAMVAAYLVGSKGKPRHAVALGLTVTATHTSTVYLIGFITLAAAEFVAPERLYLYLGIASGAMVIALGGALLFSRVSGALRPKAEGAHRHGIFGRSHTHAPAEHHQEHAHEHEDGHAHAHEGAGVTWRSLLTLGVSGGLLPCPSAIVVMLAAISFGKILFGMLLIVAFSLGLAAVLSAIGLALVMGRRVSKTSRLGSLLARPAAARLMTVMPIVSAFGVTLAGVYITYQAWSQPGL